MTKNFLRRIWSRHSKLGKKRKKKQKWKNPTGRDNKMREKRRGYPAVVSKGYRNNKTERGKVTGKVPIRVHNEKDLKGIGKNSIVIIGKVGEKRKLELMKKLTEMKAEIQNPLKEKLNKPEKEK